MHRSLLSLSLLLALVLHAPRPAHAVVVLEMSDETLARTSSLVIEGRVTAMRSRPGRGLYWAETDVTLRVDRVHSGTLSSPAVVVTVPGGRRGERVQVVPGAPRFAVGGRYLAFLVPFEGRWIVQGWAQGLYRLHDDPDGGSPRLERRLEGLSTPSGRPVADAPRRLDELLETVGATRATR